MPKLRLPARLRRISKKGYDFIVREEGVRLHPYNDAVGYATIGVGHLIRMASVRASDRPITMKQAYKLLRKDAKLKSADHVRAVLSAAKYRPTQYEFDALCSLVFNTGPGVLDSGRSLGDAIRTRNRLAIANAMLMYKMAGGKPILLRRRQRERHLFLKGVYR